MLDWQLNGLFILPSYPYQPQPNSAKNGQQCCLRGSCLNPRSAPELLSFLQLPLSRSICNMWIQHLEFIRFFADVLCLVKSSGRNGSQALLSGYSGVQLPLCFLLNKLFFPPSKERRTKRINNCTMCLWGGGVTVLSSVSCMDKACEAGDFQDQMI